MLYTNHNIKKPSDHKPTLSEVHEQEIKRKQKITNPINESFSKETLENIVSIISNNIRQNSTANIPNN